MTVTIRRVEASDVRPLRNQVLRPNQLSEVPEYDGDPTAVHLAAYELDTVVGCATVFPDPYPGVPSAWRLRGMAVDPERQGSGVGRAVLDAAVAVARDTGVPLLWANGRETALGFYERLGWRAVGDTFVHGPAQLPHKVILLPLDDSVGAGPYSGPR